MGETAKGELSHAPTLGSSFYIYSYFISMSQFPPFSNGELFGNSRPYMELDMVKLNEDYLRKYIKNNFE